MGLFFPIIGGVFCLIIIVLGAFAFSTVIVGFFGGIIVYLITGKRDLEILKTWWILITSLLSMIGLGLFISMF